METDRLIELAKDQLNRVLGFFPRVDSKISVLLSVDVAMLAVLAANVPPMKSLVLLSLPVVIAFLAVILIALSLYFLYQVSFPRLKGGHCSLVYFREIASRTESNFIDEFTEQSADIYLKDILGQIWRNSPPLHTRQTRQSVVLLRI